MAGVGAGTSGPAPGNAQVLRFSTEAFRERERVAAWREEFARTLLKLDIVPRIREGFRASATIFRSAQFGVLRATTSQVDQGNSLRGLVTNDNVSFVWVLSCRSRAAQLGRSTDIEPGDGVLFSHCDVGGLSFAGECRYVALALPKPVLAPLVPDIGALFARRVPAANPALRMLLRYLDIAQEGHGANDPALQRTATNHLCDLLSLTLGATRDAAALARQRGLAAARLRVMQDDIRRSCRHPGLSVHAVAARHGVTARSVQRMFEESGATFTEYVTERRLEAAHEALSDPDSSGRSVSSVAFDCGFSDVSHFNRMFRRRYGCTPTEVRSRRRTGAA
ncbi:helix-turn-helix transcriptional regulator [Dongia sp. agr-C8]